MSLRRVDEIFRPTGISRVLAPGFEWRPQQREMASAVWRTLHAGGKPVRRPPLASENRSPYLIPGIMWAQLTGACLVSTYTRTLQEQILDHDLPKPAACWTNEFPRRTGRRAGRTTSAAIAGRTVSMRCGGRSRGRNSSGPLRTGSTPPSRATSRRRRCRSGAWRARLPPPSIAGGRPFYGYQSRCTPENGVSSSSRAQGPVRRMWWQVNHALRHRPGWGGGGLPEWSAAVDRRGVSPPGRSVAEPLSFPVGERHL